QRAVPPARRPGSESRPGPGARAIRGRWRDLANAAADLVGRSVRLLVPRPDRLRAVPARRRQAVQRRVGPHPGPRAAGRRLAAARAHRRARLHRAAVDQHPAGGARGPFPSVPPSAPALRPHRPPCRAIRVLRRGQRDRLDATQPVRHRLPSRAAPPECRRRSTRGRTALDRSRREEPPQRPHSAGPLPVPAARVLPRSRRPGTSLEGAAMNRTRILALLSLLACGKGAAPPQDHIALPPGAQLKTFDPTKPGQAHLLYTAKLSGRVYATLSNARAQGNLVVTAGPGFLGGIDPFAGTVDPIDLGGSDEHQCTNPGVVRADAGKLYVACSGDFSGTTPGRGVFEVDPATKAVSRGLVTPEGIVPSGVAVTAGKIWLGDSITPQLVSIDRTTFTAADGADAGHPAIPVPCPSTGQFPFVPYVGIVNGDLYALCATTEAGVLGRFDAQTGAAKGSVAVGAQLTEFAATGDG